MQNALTSIDAVMAWIDSNESYIWTLHAPERKYIISRNEATTDPELSKKMLKQTLESRSRFGGSFSLYINKKTGTGGFWSDVIIPPQFAASTDGWHYPNQAGIGGMMGGNGVSIGEVEKIVSKEIERERELWELTRKIEELENQQAVQSNFWERQWESISQHPNFNPNTVPLAIGGLASKIINIVEIAMGVSGSSAALPPAATAAATMAQGNTETSQNTEGGIGETETFDGDKLEEVCNDLANIYPDKEPEDVLAILANKIKADPAMAAMVRQFAGF